MTTSISVSNAPCRISGFAMRSAKTRIMKPEEERAYKKADGLTHGNN